MSKCDMLDFCTCKNVLKMFCCAPDLAVETKFLICCKDNRFK